MYLEFFLLRDNGMPVVELYRLDTDTVQEIKATILGASYNLCMAGLMPTKLAERKRLAEKVAEAQSGQRTISQTDIKALAKLNEELQLAMEWYTRKISVLLSSDTGSATKAVVWTGVLADLHEAMDNLGDKLVPLCYTPTLAEHCTDCTTADGKLAAPVAPAPAPVKAPVPTMAEVIETVKAMPTKAPASKPVLKITPNPVAAALKTAEKVKGKA